MLFEPGLAGLLVLGPNLEAEVDGEGHGEGQAVFENGLLLGDVERAGGAGGVGRRDGGAGGQRPGQKRGDQELLNRICSRG